MEINTVRIHNTAAEALEDATERFFKAIYHHIPDGRYAVGDYDDLPSFREPGDFDGGFWYELSRAELIADIEDRPRPL